MEAWLIISNAQTLGLANSMRLLSNDIRIDQADVWTLRGNLDKFSETIPTYDRVVIHPQIEHGFCDFSAAKQLSRIPSIQFDAYHPDVCFVTARRQLLNGPIGAYQSMIVLAAFQLGLDVEKTRRLFRRDIFERCGFFSRWEGERKQLLERFAAHGLDMSAPFRAWSRGESFMYGIDHSKARPIHDIAHVFLQQCGIETNQTDIVPADTIMVGACFPVYPEVAETLGVEGSYMFKPHKEYKLLSLEAFIEQSFAAYAKYSLEEIAPDARFAERCDRVKSVIAAEKRQ
ncbi:MAG: WcbI family polysaccharide biosynthesis putative acetyltransferase [Rhizobium sp.]